MKNAFFLHTRFYGRSTPDYKEKTIPTLRAALVFFWILVCGGSAPGGPEPLFFRLMGAPGLHIEGLSPEGVLSWSGQGEADLVTIQFSRNLDAPGSWWTYTTVDLSGRPPRLGVRQPETRSGSDFVHVPAGISQIGADALDPHGLDLEKPRHEVKRDFSIQVESVPVTRALWNEVRDWGLQNGYPDLPPGGNGDSDAHPVTEVSWYDALKWLNARSAKEGLDPVYLLGENIYRTGTNDDVIWTYDRNGYRLPTAAEWEFMARAGTTTSFYTGDLLHPLTSPLDPNLDAAAWYGGNSGGTTHAVGLKRANAFGLHDILGNVYEWVWDPYRDYGPAQRLDGPVSVAGEAFRVARGGAFDSNAADLRVSSRTPFAPSLRSDRLGFRALRTLPLRWEEYVRHIQLGGDLNFGGVQTGSSRTMTLSIENPGSAPLTVEGVRLPEGFSGEWSGVLDPSERQEVDITFSPAQSEYYSGIVEVLSDANQGRSILAVAGNGFGSQNELPPLIPVAGVSLSPVGMTLEAGQTSLLTAEVSPPDATNPAVTFLSSNPGVADIDATGRVGAVSPGTATLTVETLDGSFTDRAVLVVTAAPPPGGLTTILEAEDAELTGVAVSGDTPPFRGTGYTEGLSFIDPGDRITFTAYVPVAGDFNLIIAHRWKWSRQHLARVNGQAVPGILTFPASSVVFAETDFGPVRLHAGDNTITIEPLQGPIQIDYLKLVSGPIPAQVTGDLSGAYVWSRVRIGAGGWVTGIDIHPGGNYAYCRTDVGGAYRLDLGAGSTTWVQLVNAASMPADKVALGRAFEPDDTIGMDGVASIASAPGDDSLVYMMYKDILYRSANRGDTWIPTTLNVWSKGNESAVNSKLLGERIAVDPLDGDVVYYASNRDGLYRTRDGGDTWVKAAGIPNGTDPFGVAAVVVDTSSPAVNGRTSIVYAAVYGSGIYRSTNGGDSWAAVPGAPTDLNVFDADVGSDGAFYYVSFRGSAYRYKHNAWTNLRPPTNQITDVSVDPSNPDHVVLTSLGGDVFSSTEQGINGWTRTSKSRVAADIPWLEWTDEEFMSNGEVVFDPATPGKLWFAQGIGVWSASFAPGQNHVEWNSISAGIEELVAKDIIKAPGRHLVQVGMDRPIFVLTNEEEYPSRHYPDFEFQSAWDIDYSAGAPNFMAAILRNENFFKTPENSGWSDDGGFTWNKFATMPAWPGANQNNMLEQGFGSIAVSATDVDNIMMNNTGLWSNLDGGAANQDLTNVYYTTDRGASWHKSLGLPERGAYPVHYHNRKNLCADAVAPDTFYYYYWRENGLYKSTNKGRAFTKVNTSLPDWAFHPVLKPVLGQEGHLLFSAGHDNREPLYRSTDGGVTFTSLTGTDPVWNFGLGKALDGGYPTIFVQGKFDGQEGYYRSTDEGATWERIAIYPMDTYGHLAAMDGCKETFGKVYIATEAFGVIAGLPVPAED